MSFARSFPLYLYIKSLLMKYYCFPLLLLSFNACLAQLLRSSPSGQYTTVGTYSRHFRDAFSFTGNQASLAGITNGNAGIYSEKRFLLRELQALSAAISFPCWQGGAGVALDYTGFTNYNESHAGVAYGRSLGANIDIGIQFNYQHINLAGYGSAAATNFEIGTIVHLTDKFHTGCHIYNPVGGKFGKNSEEKLPSLYSFGLGYEASEKLFVGSEIIKEESQPVAINVSLQYAFVKQFFIRCGLSSAVGNCFAGAGIYWKNIRLDIAASWHQQAGMTPSLLLIFKLYQSKFEQQ